MARRRRRSQASESLSGTFHIRSYDLEPTTPPPPINLPIRQIPAYGSPVPSTVRALRASEAARQARQRGHPRVVSRRMSLAYPRVGCLSLSPLQKTFAKRPGKGGGGRKRSALQIRKAVFSLRSMQRRSC